MELGPQNQNRDGFLGPNSIGSVYGPSGLRFQRAQSLKVGACLVLRFLRGPENLQQGMEDASYASVSYYRGLNN